MIMMIIIIMIIIITIYNNYNNFISILIKKIITGVWELINVPCHNRLRYALWPTTENGIISFEVIG